MDPHRAEKPRIIAVIGPTASGKTARAVQLAQERNGEVISVDSRQVYRTLDIGTEKITVEEMQGVPHHLMDIRDPEERYSAGDFAHDAARLIAELHARGKVPILAGGTHFYFDALLHGLPGDPVLPELREALEQRSTEALFAELVQKDPRRAARIDPANKRRLVRALEIVATRGSVPERVPREPTYDVEWVVIDLPREELRTRIDARLAQALERGLVEEVALTRERLSERLGGSDAADTRLNELGLEYRVVGEYLRGERDKDSLLPALSSRLWRYARTQKRWVQRLANPGA